MKTKILISILVLTSGCSVTKNPYYKMSVGLPHVYFTEAENKVYKIESEALITGNTLKAVIPSELGGVNAKGDARYEIEVNQRMKVRKIYLVAIRVNDSVNNKFLLYQRYDPSKPHIEKPGQEEEEYNKYFLKEISKLRFKQVSLPANRNKVYCNYIF